MAKGTKETFEFLGADYTTPLEITTRERVLLSETLSLRRQATVSDAQRWEITVGLAADNGTNSLGAKAGRHRAVNGVHTAFDMPMPQYIGTYEEMDVHDSTDIIAKQDVSNLDPAPKEILIDSSGNNRYTIPEGRFFKFSNHNKIYMVTEEVDTEANAGNKTLKFTPALNHTISANSTTLNFVDPEVNVFYREEGNTRVSYQQGILTNLTMQVVENII